MNDNISEVIKELKKWYLQDLFIVASSIVIFILGVLTGIGFIGFIISAFLIFKKWRLQKKVQEHALKVESLDVLTKKIEERTKEKDRIIQETINEKDKVINEKDKVINEKDKIIEKIRREAQEKVKAEMSQQHRELAKVQYELKRTEDYVLETNTELARIEKKVETQNKKVERLKLLYKGLEYAIDNQKLLPEHLSVELAELCPTVALNIHSMDVKDLRKEFKENEKAIQSMLDKYSSGYTTKANRTIYKLMVLALSAELQNVLYNLKYTNLDQSNELIYALIKKYRALVVEGNQSIAPVMNRCISELEYFYLNAVQIEYKYYIAKEMQKNEQAALREQMKQEAEERKQIEAQRKLIEKEESKYLAEIQRAQEQLKLQKVHDEMSQQLLDKIAQLESQLQDVGHQKEEILKRQNGKAGYVYVISNLGSFGEDVFKVGMTRRLDPMDRIKELGDASVPFLFDVHSFIFSDDAIGLEQKLHQALESHRVNKINPRKEFFKVSLDELEALVLEIDSTAEFNRTMIAEEYRQSLVLAQTQ